jgi:hypothetical protein
MIGAEVEHAAVLRPTKIKLKKVLKKEFFSI